MKKYYELSIKDIVKVTKLADKAFENMIKDDPSLLDDIHDSWLLQSTLRFAYLKTKEKAKRKFTPLKYRN